MNEWIGEVLLVLLAMLLIFIELFVPSGGALMVAAVLIFVYAIYTLFADGQAAVAWVLIVSTAIYSVVIFRFWISKIRLAETLGASAATGADVVRASGLIGSSGVTTTELRPAGMAKIEGKRYDVVTNGSFLEKGTPIIVVETSGNRIVVRRDHKE